jgi:hypothetical protein
MNRAPGFSTEVSSSRFMDDFWADKADTFSLHAINHKGSTSVKDVLSTSDKDKDELMIKGTAIPPSLLTAAIHVARWPGPEFEYIVATFWAGDATHRIPPLCV